MIGLQLMVVNVQPTFFVKQGLSWNADSVRIHMISKML